MSMMMMLMIGNVSLYHLIRFATWTLRHLDISRLYHGRFAICRRFATGRQRL